MGVEKLSLKINSQKYDINANGDFKEFLHHSLINDFDTESNNDLKKLLNAYVKSTYKLFKLENELNELDIKLNDVNLFKK